MPSDIATPARRSARFNATASTSATTTTTTTAPTHNLRKRARPASTESPAAKPTPLKATKRRKIAEEPVEEVKDVKGKGRARLTLPVSVPEPSAERPNHRKRKSMSALDDAVVLKKGLAEEAELEVVAGRRTRKKAKSDEVIQEAPRKTRHSASKTLETPARKPKAQAVRPPTVRRVTRSLLSSPATPALPVTTPATATAVPPRQPPSPALSALSSLPPSPTASPTQPRPIPPPLSLSDPLPAESTNSLIQRQTDAVAPTTQRITRYAEKKEEAPNRAGSPTPSTSSPLATSAVLEPEGSVTKGRKAKGKAKVEAKQEHGTKRKRGGPVAAAPIRRSRRLHPDVASNAPAASSPLAARPAASTKPAASLHTPPTSAPASPAIPPLSLSLAQLSPTQTAQRHQGPHGGPRSSPVSPLAPPHESLPPVTPPLPTTNVTSSPLAAEPSASTLPVSTPSSPTRSPQMTLDRMDFGTVNLPSMGNIPALNLGPSSFGNGPSSNGGSNGGKKTPGSGSPRTSPLLRPMVPSALGLGMVTAGELSPTAEKLEETSPPRTAPSPPIRTQPSTPAAPPTPAQSPAATTPVVEEPPAAAEVPPSPTTSSAPRITDDPKRSPSPAPSTSSAAEQPTQPQLSSSPPLPSPLQDGALLPQLPVASGENPATLVDEPARPSTPAPFAHQQHQMYPPQHYDLYHQSPAQDTQNSSPSPMDGPFRPSSPAPEHSTQVHHHHHTPPPIHTPTYNQTHSLADALGSPPPSPVHIHHAAVGVPQLPDAQQQHIPEQQQDPLEQIQILEGVQQIQIPEATPQEIVQCQPQAQGLVQVQLDPAPQQSPHDQQGEQQEHDGQMQVVAPVPLPVSAQSSPQQQGYSPPVWEEPPRLDTEKNLWRLACKVRVWDLRRRYSPEAIRALVTQEAHEYYEKHGFPIGYFTSSSRSSSAGPSSSSSIRNPVAYGGQPVSPYTNSPTSPSSSSLSGGVASGSDAQEGEEGTSEAGGVPGGPTTGLHFMDEPVYDWEINSNSDDEDDLEAEFDDEDYEDDVEEDVDPDAKGEEEAAEETPKDVSLDVKGKGKAKEDGGEEAKEASQGPKRSPKKKRKVDVDVPSSPPKRRAASAPTPGSTSTEVSEEGAGEKEMEVDSEDDHDLEEVNVHATSPTSEKQQQQLDVEAQAEEEARRRDLDEALSDPSFNLELSSPTATSPTALAFGEASAARERSISPSSPSPSPGGAFTAFYVPPAPRTVGVYLDAPSENAEQATAGEQDMEGGGYQETPAQSITPPPASPLQVHLQMPMSPILEIPPPRLSTVPVWALRSMDMMVGGSMGRGTPVDKDRKMEWVTVKPRYSTPPMSPSPSGELFNVGGRDVKKEHGGDGGEERDRKPVLRLSMPGEDGGMNPGVRGDQSDGRVISGGSSNEKAGGAGDAPFEPNDADWAAFLADLAAGGAQSSSASSIPGPSSQVYSQQEYQGHPPPYTPSSSTTLSLPGQHQQQQQQQQQHPAFGMNVNMNLTNMFNMGNGVPVSGSPTTLMNFMPMHNMGNNMMNMGGMGNMSMPPLASPMPIGVNTPLSSPTLQVSPSSMSPPHPSSAPPTPPPGLVNVPMNMFGMGFGGNVQIGGASLQLGLTVSLTPGVGNNVNNSWFGSPPSSPPALNIGPDGCLIQDQQQQQQQQQGGGHVQGSSGGSYTSPTTPTHEFDSNGMFGGMGQMQGAMGVMSYGHPMNMGVAMGMGNGMGGGVAMGMRDGMSGMGGHSHPTSPIGNGEANEGSGSAQASPVQTSTASTLSYALG